MKDFLPLVLFCMVCACLSLACVIGADYLVAIDTHAVPEFRVDQLPEPPSYHSPTDHHMLWEWLQIAAWVFGAIPVIGFVAAVCVTCDEPCNVRSPDPPPALLNPVRFDR
ncbi:hypothetical protein [Allorhodopirellula heiligendammensis]|uniref:Lipoprotein n=1 Tax=Allorhodopirellula heiligendammensis TaxID=2714739 RepID=A0A5C6BYL0_9BACT|nr:hypothetical protein [Allorhodopirellula heiligendammensis]TWU15964.1 hypothetical protein Poly21_31680 [Allorhodopirellula heiligendammensis]